MKRILTLLISLNCYFLWAQTPEIYWQNTIGGSSSDMVYSVVPNLDGSSLIAGNSFSPISGDKTEGSYGGNDFWVLNLDNSGNIVWQKTYGGLGNEYIKTAKKTLDGGYILGGYSSSGVSGNKSEANFGGSDYWVVKINSTGSIEWQKSYGGDTDDFLTAIVECNEGGYMIAGYSSSNNSGNKTTVSLGDFDYWVIKIDNLGNVIWQNSYGGTGSDMLTTIATTPTNSYILGGHSTSGISTDKSEGGYGAFDFWVVEINNDGDIIWNNTVGGSSTENLNAMVIVQDGIIIGGNSLSGISGEKSDTNRGLNDYWIVKLSFEGNLLWDNTFGGNNSDYLYSICQSSSGSIVLCGYSNSVISGDKTVDNFGFINDVWLIRVNSSGELLTQTVVGGTSFDYLYAATVIEGESLLLGASSSSGISGLKSEGSNGTFDYWIIKTNLCWGTEVCNGLDDNCDGLIDEELLFYPFYFDGDSDGFGDSDSAILNCMLPVGFVENALDCDDSNELVFPNAEENYDGVDNDCDGGIDNYKFELDWSKCILGNDLDIITSINLNQDGSYIVGGYSTSEIGSDKTVETFPIYSNDFWILKLSETGAIIWQKSIGGADADMLTVIKPTSDDGYIVCGYSNSPVSGNKNEANLGEMDYWILKLNSVGDIVWQNTLGGSGNDYAMDIVESNDGTFIVGGYSNSNISGDKSMMSFGEYDYWVVKLSASGVLLNQSQFGGAGDDELSSIKVDADNNFYLTGSSESNITGNKESASKGLFDYWVIKLDLSLSQIWQKSYGGNNNDYCSSLDNTDDGGVILGGYSVSPISGDKTENTHGSYDYWIIKLDSFGNITWQNDIGGNQLDQANKIIQTFDGGYLIGGKSESNLGFDKLQNNPPYSDALWIVKLDINGNLYRQNVVNVYNDNNVFADIVETPDLGFTLGGYCYTFSDYCIYNFQLDCNLTIPESCNGMDDNCNGLIDEGVEPISSWLDADIDGYGDIANIVVSCIIPPGYINNDSDCNDSIATINPGTLEVCNLLDDNCNGSIDDGVEMSTYYQDLDHDDFGNTSTAILACFPPEGYITLGFDCNDLLASINPSALEICNSIDDNCDGNLDESVVETISITATGATTFCAGTGVTLTAVHTGTSLQWKRNGNNIAGANFSNYLATVKGNYSCQTNSICGSNVSNSISVTVNKNPTATITADGPTSICAGDFVTLTVTTGPGLTYQWYKGALALAGATNSSYIASAAGNYKCRVTKTSTGCYKNSNSIAVSIVCKESDEVSKNSQQYGLIYPNPANENLYINTNNTAIKSIFVYNSVGQLILTQISSEANINLYIKDFSSGVYFIEIHEDSFIFTDHFIKN